MQWSVALVVIVIIILLYFYWGEGFTSRESYVVSRSQGLIDSGPPIYYKDFLKVVPDGDAVEFDLVRRLTTR